MSAFAQSTPTLDGQLRRLVNDAIAEERERVSRAILSTAAKRRTAFGPGDAVFTDLTILATALVDNRR